MKSGITNLSSQSNPRPGRIATYSRKLFSTMRKQFVSVLFDRKKRVSVTGEGKVELCIYLSRTERKFVTVKTVTPLLWRKYQKSEELKLEMAMYEQVAEKMARNGEEMTVANLDSHLGIVHNYKDKSERQKKLSSPRGFIEFMEECIKKEKLAPATLQRKRVTIDAMERFGKLSRFDEVTDLNVKAFDDFLHNECDRCQTTIHNYHKIVKMYTNLAFQMGYIFADPYKMPLCKFKRGKYKDRRPLTEDELIQIRELDNLSGREERARDLFIFCAYTGLAYIDSQMFDYDTMTETLKDGIYIVGQRVKTGSSFYTPILPPAMKVLEKYGYQLPHISNQKANDYLHLIESRVKLNKPLTMHVARHSFATLALSYDVPIENVGKMLGHTKIRTTQIYAKILKSTIERHTLALASKIR